MSITVGRFNNWNIDCEEFVNKQITLEYWASLQYHVISSYFSHHNIGLENISKYFNKCSLEEREHADKLIEYQNKRGGRAKKWQDGLNAVLLRNHIFNDYVKATKLIVPKEDTQNVTDMSFNGLNTNLQDYFAKRFQATPFQNYVNDTFFSGNSVENVKLILEPFQKGAFLWSDHIIKDFVKSPFYQRDFRNMVQKVGTVE